MKTGWLFGLLAIVALGGCGTGTQVTFLQTHTPPRPFVPRAVDSVELLTLGSPQRPYVEVGMLEAQQESAYSVDTPQVVLDKLRERAAALGCDALVITGDNNAAGNTVNGATTLKGYRGTCIFYTGDAPAPAAASAAPAAAPATAAPPAAPPAAAPATAAPPTTH